MTTALRVPHKTIILEELLWQGCHNRSKAPLTPPLVKVRSLGEALATRQNRGLP